MILEALFIHLRRGRPGKFLATHVLNFYGRLFIGGPKVEDFPKQAPLPVRKRIVETWFNHHEDRLPEKRLERWEVGQLKAAQLRDEEEKRVAKLAFIYSAILCTLLYGLGVAIHKGASGIEAKVQQHKAEAAARDAREYAGKRDTLKKQWAEDVAGYTAQRCIDKVSSLRVRNTDELRDHYAVMEAGCEDKRTEIEGLAKSWTLDDCADFGVAANKQLAAGGSTTWVDELIFRNVCFANYGQALQARLK